MSCSQLLTVKTYDVTEHLTRPRAWTDILVEKRSEASRSEWKAMQCTAEPQDVDRWQALENVAINVWVALNEGKCLTG